MSGLGRVVRPLAAPYVGAVVECVEHLGIYVRSGCRGTVLAFEPPDPTAPDHAQAGGWRIDFTNVRHEPHQVVLAPYSLERIRVLSPLEVLAEQAE